MIQYNFTNLRRITKTTARKLYNNGEKVFFIPCNMNPENKFFNIGVWLDNSSDDVYNSFEKRVNTFEYYNCTYETGYYTSFYIEK